LKIINAKEKVFYNDYFRSTRANNRQHDKQTVSLSIMNINQKHVYFN